MSTPPKKSDITADPAGEGAGTDLPIRQRFPLGTYVVGHVHGNSFQGHVTGWGTEHGIYVDHTVYPVSRVTSVTLPVFDDDIDLE